VTKYESIIIGLAAIVAGIVYLARGLAQLATAIKYIADHPATHVRQDKLTADNTAAINGLTEQLGRMVAQPTGRRGR
jgi:hypothetical protein